MLDPKPVSDLSESKRLKIVASFEHRDQLVDKSISHPNKTKHESATIKELIYSFSYYQVKKSQRQKSTGWPSVIEDIYTVSSIRR